jgi:hypothetical protein
MPARALPRRPPCFTSKPSTSAKVTSPSPSTPRSAEGGRVSGKAVMWKPPSSTTGTPAARARSHIRTASPKSCEVLEMPSTSGWPASASSRVSADRKASAPGSCCSAEALR